MSSGETNDERRIAIVGAGISGLLACKHAIEKGFKPVVFEARNNVGGVWSNTIHSTKLQSPKDYFQFSDFPWPESVSETFPDHNRVLDYITSYACRFDLFPLINFNSKVVSINYVSSEDTSCWSMWGGSGEPFHAHGKWDVVVQDALRPMEAPKVYEVDFVILCIGKFSDLPNVPQFPISKGPNAFKGEVIHSMEYAAMDKVEAQKLVENKRVTVVGFRKSALDIAAQIAQTNGDKYPCTLLFRRVHWAASENLVRFTFGNLNRFSELMIHRPYESLILWFLAFSLSPLRWIFSKLVECYLKWKYPLKKYDMVPDHSFLRQIRSCMLMMLPQNFYERVKEGSLVLKKSAGTLGFYENGLLLANDETVHLETDVVIFATGYKSDEKISNIFTSVEFKKCITASSAPFYRECIHPRIPQLAILGYSESPATLFTFELRSKWLAHFLVGEFRLPSVRRMEEDVERWEKNGRRYSHEDYKRACVGAQLQIHCNDQLCKDMGCKPRRKKWFLPELFSPYHPADYADL
ncbi:putative flavin-containing monooxygenase 1 [Sesamum alatum]|uniref:Flavin-containing monooxygenase n=1 Tax=Sesamum alatum TaxID=300844 RepID=A0AAE1YE26_9LAMI|nr:putative flavin-containing monooxygenase 1 [Sesamum alatum]